MSLKSDQLEILLGVYLNRNSNMQVSFNKIINIMLVCFVSCYLSLSSNLIEHCIQCTKNSGLERVLLWKT